jgi:hypothetical protein
MNTASKYLPIRKVALGFVASGVVYLAKRIGLDVGPSEVNDLLEPVIGFAVAFAVKDPQVKTALDAVDTFATEHPEAAAELHELADRFVAQHDKTQAAVTSHYQAAANLASSASEARQKVRSA